MATLYKDVIIKFQIEALHCWKDIPESHPSHYLKHPHRHNFHFQLRFIVEGSNREIEFINKKNQVESTVRAWADIDPPSGLLSFGEKSCEMLAEDLLRHYLIENCWWVEVLEDGEMGALVYVAD